MNKNDYNVNTAVFVWVDVCGVWMFVRKWKKQNIERKSFLHQTNITTFISKV